MHTSTFDDCFPYRKLPSNAAGTHRGNAFLEGTKRNVEATWTAWIFRMAHYCGIGVRNTDMYICIYMIEGSSTSGDFTGFQVSMQKYYADWKDSGRWCARLGQSDARGQIVPSPMYDSAIVLQSSRSVIWHLIRCRRMRFLHRSRPENLLKCIVVSSWCIRSFCECQNSKLSLHTWVWHTK